MHQSVVLVRGRSFFLFLLNILEGRIHRFNLQSAQMPVNIVLCDLCHRAGQYNNADQVRNHHQAIEGICQIPCQVFTQNRSEVNRDDKQDSIDDCQLFAQQVLAGFGAVMAPAKHSGVCEQHDGNSNER